VPIATGGGHSCGWLLLPMEPVVAHVSSRQALNCRNSTYFLQKLLYFYSYEDLVYPSPKPLSLYGTIRTLGMPGQGQMLGVYQRPDD
jgi:hypothetical protein